MHAGWQNVQRGVHVLAAGSTPALDQNVGAASSRGGDRLLEATTASLGRQWPCETAGGIGVTKLQRGDQRPQGVDELVLATAVHQDPISGRAALAGGQVATDDNLVCCLANVGIVEHHHGVLATHLESQQQLRAVHQGCREFLPHGI